MTTVLAVRPLYASITTQLATTGKAVGQAVSPGGDPPYMVLYPLPDQFTEGSLSDANQIRVELFQVTCVGDSMMEAQWMQEKAQIALLGFTPTGGTRIELDQASGVFRDDDGPVFYTTDRFRVHVS